MVTESQPVTTSGPAPPHNCPVSGSPLPISCMRRSLDFRFRFVSDTQGYRTLRRPSLPAERINASMPITLRYHAQTTVPVEVEGVVPDRIRDKSLGEIERIDIFHGNRKIPLAELFSVCGDPSDAADRL